MRLLLAHVSALVPRLWLGIVGCYLEEVSHECEIRMNFMRNSCEICTNVIQIFLEIVRDHQCTRVCEHTVNASVIPQFSLISMPS